MNTRTIPGHHQYTGQSQSMAQPATTSSHAAQLSSGNLKDPVSVDSKDSSSLNLQEQERLVRQQALSSAQQGKYTEAIALLTKLIDRNPLSASNYNNRGLLHFQNGQYEEALMDYDQALLLDPQLAKVYNNRANCYASLGYLAEAIADYETAIDLDPANIHAWINQGITFRDLEMYGQAIDNLDLALRFSEVLQNPKTTDIALLKAHIYAERGRTYHLSGDWNCAIADYRRALEILAHVSLSGVNNKSQRRRSQVQNWMNELLEPISL